MIRVLEPNKDYIIRADRNGIVDDVVEVVRCKDCRFTSTEEYVFVGGNRVGTTLSCLKHEMYVDDNDFCSMGERREDET